MRRSFVVAAAAAVLVLLGAWAWVDYAAARDNLESARTTVEKLANDPSTVRTGEGRVAVVAQIRGARRQIQRARNRVRYSPLALTWLIPGLHTQRAGAIRLISDADVAAAAIQTLLTHVDGLSSQVRIRDGAVPVAALAPLETQLDQARAQLSSVVRSTRGLWGPLARARRSFNRQAATGARRLSDGTDAVRVARPFLGASGDRRYLIAIQNNAEMRDQGMVLSYAIVTTSGGRLKVERTGHITDLDQEQSTSTPVPLGTQKLFGEFEPTRHWQSANTPADFAFSGRVMHDMVEQKTGLPFDGIVGIDIPALAHVLAATGPVTVPGLAEQLTADNAVRVLLHDLYDGLPASRFAGESDVQRASRFERQGDATSAVLARLTAGDYDVVDFGRQLGAAATGGHLRMWSDHPAEEAILERLGLGGGPALHKPDRTFHVAVMNRTGTKLDYYVRVSVSQKILLTEYGAAIVNTLVTIDNQAPVGAAPSYQLGPDENVTKPGDYLAQVVLWGPAGSDQPLSEPESGLQGMFQVIPVSAGEKKQAQFLTVVPGAVRNGKFELRYVPQPRLEDVPVKVDLETRGWKLHGASARSIVLDRTRTISWRLDPPAFRRLKGR